MAWERLPRELPREEFWSRDYDLYFHAWNHGLKTTYYLRNKGASSIEKSTVSKVSESAEPEIENISACSITNPECESCQ